MKKAITAALGAGAILLGALTSPLMAGSLGMGISGHGILFEADGTETLTNDVATTKTGYSEAGAIPSGYIQYTFGEDGLVFGLERIPGELDLGTHNQATRADCVTGSTTPCPNVVQKVNAKLADHKAIYIETPAIGWGGSGGLFARAGYSRVTLETAEVLGTGGSYGDGDDIDGVSIAAGFRGTAANGFHVKFMVEQTDYDSVTLLSNDSANGATKVKVDMDTFAARLSVGINF